MATALITGASAGIGLELARLFAADRHDLVLVARRRDRLEHVAGELEKLHGIKTAVFAADLLESDAASKITEEIARLGVDVDFLVNNAGFGDTGRFDGAPLGKQLGMIQVNVTALTALTHAFLAGMLQRKRGRILNIGSTAGFQPGPFMTAYYASKAYVNSFTEALSYELRGTGVTATLSCPGPTLTEFAQLAGNDKSRLFALGAMPAIAVAKQAYRAMHAGRPMIVHGLLNAFGVFALRFTPRFVLRWLVARLNRTTSGS